MSFEVIALGLVVGLGAAAVKVASDRQVESKMQTSKAFARTFERLVPPEGASCGVCGDALNAENTKIIAMDMGASEPILVCSKTECVLAYMHRQRDVTPTLAA